MSFWGTCPLPILASGGLYHTANHLARLSRACWGLEGPLTQQPTADSDGLGTHHKWHAKDLQENPSLRFPRVNTPCQRPNQTGIVLHSLLPMSYSFDLLRWMAKEFGWLCFSYQAEQQNYACSSVEQNLSMPWPMRQATKLIKISWK